MKKKVVRKKVFKKKVIKKKPVNKNVNKIKKIKKKPIKNSKRLKINKTKSVKLKSKKSLNKKSNKKKRFIWFCLGVGVFTGLLLLNFILAFAKLPSEIDSNYDAGLASLKFSSSEDWCNGADINRDRVVDSKDLYIARQNLGNVKNLYFILQNFGRIDCKG